MTDGDFVLSDARLVLQDRVIRSGWIAVSNGRIAALGEGAAPSSAYSIGGDTLMPGLVELHTDHLEVHAEPRPSVEWHPLAAVLAYDAQIASSGITTVFDCHRLGNDVDTTPDAAARVEARAAAVSDAAARGLLRADHHAHIRCELAAPEVVELAERFVASFPVRLMSLMDHTPGQRQYRDAEKLRIFCRGRLGLAETAIDELFEARLALHRAHAAPNRRALVELAHRHAIPIASHDDTTVRHVAESLADGARVAEFPTTAEAATASHAAGIAVMMGAPNLVRGGSHAGNIAAEALARSGELDILSSDYIPVSLLQAAFELPRRVSSISLAEAVTKVTFNPARAAGFADRGVLAEGKRADLVRVFEAEVPVVRGVWVEGRRVT